MEIPVSTYFTPDQNDRLRTGVVELVQKLGSQAAVERATGLDQTFLSRLIAGTTGGSYRSAAIIARELGVAVKDLIGGSVVTPETLSEMKGFKAALAEARRRGADRYTDDVWVQVGEMTIAPLDVVDADVLMMAAAMVLARRPRKLTSGSDTSPPSRPAGGGHRRSGSKLRKR